VIFKIIVITYKDLKVDQRLKHIEKIVQ